MYTIIVTHRSGAHSVTITDSDDVKHAVVEWQKKWSSAQKIEVLHPNHQTRDRYFWNIEGRFWEEKKNLENKI